MVEWLNLRFAATGRDFFFGEKEPSCALSGLMSLEVSENFFFCFHSTDIQAIGIASSSVKPFLSGHTNLPETVFTMSSQEEPQMAGYLAGKSMESVNTMCECVCVVYVRCVDMCLWVFAPDIYAENRGGCGTPCSVTLHRIPLGRGLCPEAGSGMAAS